MPRICLVTPGHLSTNPRLVKEAHALTAAGYDVQIVHGRYLPWGVENDEAVSLPHWELFPVAFGKREAHPLVHIRQRATQNAAARAYRLGLRTTRIAAIAHSPVSADLIEATRNAPRADLYIAHYPSALAAAAIAAREHGVPFCFDAEDFHLGDLPDEPKHDVAKSLIFKIENTYLPHAAYISAASPLIADAYAETYRVTRPTPILNVFPKSNAPAAPTPGGETAPGPSLYWFSQTIGPGRGLETALQAIALAASKPHLYLRGTPATGYRARLEQCARELSVTDRLHILPPAPPSEMERIGSRYDIGLAGEIANTKNHDIALANKIFSYMMSGIPCLATNISSHLNFNEIYPEYLNIFELNDATDLAEKIDDIILDKAKFRMMRKNAWDMAQNRMNWDNEKQLFIESVNKAI